MKLRSSTGWRPQARAAIVLIQVTGTALAANGQLVIQGAPPSVGFGLTTPMMTVQRQDLDGGALAAGQPALSVTLTSSSDGGYFEYQNTCCTTAYAPTPLALTIPAGSSSVSFAYADMESGSAMLSVDGGAGWLNAPLNISVSSETWDDTFEIDDLASGWNFTACAQPSMSVTVQAAAAHRGDGGARLVDNWGTSGGGPGTSEPCGVGLNLPVGITGDYYMRGWWRVTASNGLGSPVFALVQPVGIELQPQTNIPIVAWPYNAPLSAPFTYGPWHLVEVGLLGAGTADAGWKVWVDGVLTAVDTGLTINNGATWLSIGEPITNDGSFVGVIDVDDVRMGRPVPGSTLTVGNGGGALTQFACNPVTVLLSSSDGQGAQAPYAVTAALSSTPISGQFFLDSSCSQATTTVTLPMGRTSVPIFFMPELAGTTALRADQIDFLSTSTQLVVAQGTPPLDAGAGARLPHIFVVGCTCGSGGGSARHGWLASLTVLVALAAMGRVQRRGRRRRAGVTDGERLSAREAARRP